MEPIESLQSFAETVASDGATVSMHQLVLGAALIVLIGGMMMPQLILAARGAFIVGGFFIRRVWRYLID